MKFKMRDRPQMTKDHLYLGRDGEAIGGGFFVFRRGKKTGRIGAGSSLPFEHASFESASKEAERLAKETPGEEFCVFQEVSSQKRDRLTSGQIAFMHLVDGGLGNATLPDVPLEEINGLCEAGYLGDDLMSTSLGRKVLQNLDRHAARHARQAQRQVSAES